ncbi:MAG: hypothetical protein IBX43_05270 [Campylobacterales bacterium]|nr:hypothetical protein [Campylobacterales bacterium]
MKTLLQPIEALQHTQTLKEVELMLTLDELKTFGAYCTAHNIKFNDWIRLLAHEALEKEKKEG